MASADDPREALLVASEAAKVGDYERAINATLEAKSRLERAKHEARQDGGGATDDD